MKICIKIARELKSYSVIVSNAIYESNSLTKVTTSTEDGKILSQSSSFVTSQLNTFIRLSSKFECSCIYSDTNTYIYRYCIRNHTAQVNRYTYFTPELLNCTSEKVKQTLTRVKASVEKSQALTKSFGYAATRGNIVFPAPKPTCKSL